MRLALCVPVTGPSPLKARSRFVPYSGLPILTPPRIIGFGTVIATTESEPVNNVHACTAQAPLYIVLLN